MLKYGFNLETLYFLQLDTLYDIVRIIRDNDAMIAPDKDVIIRGCIIPFLRDAAKASESASKDEVLRLALIATAKKVGMSVPDWNKLSTDDIASTTLYRVRAKLAQRLDQLDAKQMEAVLGVARNSLIESSKAMRVPLAGAGAVLAGEMSGFGVYLATTTGLHALSLALGTTFSWGVYQGATAVLGIILGPVGWAIAGIGVVGSLALSIRNWAAGKRERRMVLSTVALLLAIGENPFRFFGLTPDSSREQVNQVSRAIAKTFHPDMLDKNLPQWILDDFANKWLRYYEAREKISRIMEGSKENE